MVLELLHWIGATLGAVAFFLLPSLRAGVRLTGFALSAAGVAILIPWAIVVEAYGLLILWCPILVASILGVRTNLWAWRLGVAYQRVLRRRRENRRSPLSWDLGDPLCSVDPGFPHGVDT